MNEDNGFDRELFGYTGAIGIKIAYAPIFLTEKSEYKIVRLMGWLLTITIWTPFVLVGYILLLMGLIETGIRNV